MNIQGLSASAGEVYSEFETARLEALNISSGRVATIIRSTVGSGTAHTPVVLLGNAIGGDARLVTSGVNTANQSDTSLHPRTAVGVKADGKLLLLTVDGRNPGHSLGVSTPELADLMIDFGAVDAINLDGGGSTTLVFADPMPRLVNIPVGVGNVPGTERVVGNNLGIFATPPSQPNPTTFVFADFNLGDEGSFGYGADYSGSTAGILAANSTVDAVPRVGIDGSWAQRLVIRDGPATSGVAENPLGWFVRHVSGDPGVAPAAREANTPRPTIGSVGFWARTFSLGVEAAIAIDDSFDVTADRGIRRPLIADGQWHRYAWDLENNSHWTPWVGGDGIIDTSDFTIDSIQLFGPNADATVLIDNVFHCTASIARGDYNADGLVDWMDYAVWKQSFGTPFAADGNGDGVVDAADYTVWRDSFSAAVTADIVTAAVPEPGTIGFFLGSCLFLLARARNRWGKVLAYCWLGALACCASTGCEMALADDASTNAVTRDSDTGDLSDRYIVLNLHPEEVSAETFARLEELADIRKAAAPRIGVGAIFSYLHQPRDKMMERLRRFLQLSVEYDLPVVVQLDGEQWWDDRPDLWNWWDPSRPGYDPANANNVEWIGWGPEHALKIAWRNWGRQLRVLPPPNLMSKRYRDACRVSATPLLQEIVRWRAALPKSQTDLLIGVKVGGESSIGVNHFYYPGGNDLLAHDERNDPHRPLKPDDVRGRGVQPIGYAAVLTCRLATGGELQEEHVVEVVRRHLADLAEMACEAGLPREIVFAHSGGWARGEQLYSAPLNQHSCPAWSFYERASDPRRDDTAMAALVSSNAPYWAAAEWYPHKASSADQWADAIHATLTIARCRYLCVYNWRNVAREPSALEGIRRVLAREAARSASH